MPKYYEGEAVVKAFTETTNQSATWARGVLARMKEADVAQVVHAHWKYIGMMPDASYIYECSKCGRRIFIDWTFLLKDYPSCHCGARMDEEAAE